MTLGEIALAYAARGWPVFPLEPRGKRPLARLAPHGLYDATTDTETVTRWWEVEPNANIGLPTGEQFDALDLDNQDAIDTFRREAEAHGDNPANFPRVRTGRGGRHLFVAATGAGNRARLMPGADWRGRGGYVVAAGSIHESGRTYEWLSEPNGEIPPCPPWLAELALGSRPEPSEQPRSDHGPAPQQYVARAVQGELESLKAAQEGERNDRLNRAAFALGQMVGAGWYARATAEQELADVAHHLGLPQHEVRATIRSGLDSGELEPRQPPATGWSRAEAGGQIGRPALTVVTPDADQLGAFDALRERGPDWAAKASEQVDALVPGVLVAGGIGFLISDPKAGKTWFAMEMAVSITSAQPFFHHYPVAKPGRVLYIATEGRRDAALIRLTALCLGHGLDVNSVLHHMDFIWRRGVRLDDPAFAVWLAQVSTEYRLVIVDVLVDAWEGDENSSAQVSKLLRSLRPICDLGVTILLLHHLSKAAGGDIPQSLWQRLRGSTAFRGAYDSGIALERGHGQKRTTVTFEHRDDAPVNSFTFTWPDDQVDGTEPVTLDWQPKDESLDGLQAAQRKVLATIQQHPGLSRTEAIKQSRVNRALGLEAVQSLISAGQLGTETGERTLSDGRHRIYEVLVPRFPTGSEYEIAPPEPLPEPLPDENSEKSEAEQLVVPEIAGTTTEPQGTGTDPAYTRERAQTHTREAGTGTGSKDAARRAKQRPWKPAPGTTTDPASPEEPDGSGSGSEGGPSELAGQGRSGSPSDAPASTSYRFPPASFGPGGTGSGRGAGGTGTPCRASDRVPPGCAVHWTLLDANGRCPVSGQQVAGQTQPGRNPEPDRHRRLLNTDPED